MKTHEKRQSLVGTHMAIFSGSALGNIFSPTFLLVYLQMVLPQLARHLW